MEATDSIKVVWMYISVTNWHWRADISFLLQLYSWVTALEQINSSYFASRFLLNINSFKDLGLVAQKAAAPSTGELNCRTRDKVLAEKEGHISKARKENTQG